MAQTFQAKLVQEGHVLDHTPSSAVSAGDVVIQDALFGVANQAIAASALGAIQVAGVYNVVKITGAMTAGTQLFWDATGDPVGGTSGTGAATETASGNTFIGFNVLAALEAAEFVTALLVPAIAVTNNGVLASVISDPGASGAIPVTGNGSCALVSGGAETRTLAAPSFIGQQISIYLKTDGGTVILTVATTVAEGGGNTITFDNTGEVLVLVAVEEGANLRWRTMLTDGAAVTTV